MCSSKSEPDISKIARSKEDFIVFSGSPSGQSPRRKTDHEATARPQTTGSRHSTPSAAPGSPAPSNERRSASRPKSQLPVPSSRGPQPRANSSSTAPRTPTMTANRNATRTEPSSSKTRQAPTRHNNNVNENNQQHEDIWILHRDLHEDNNNTK